MGEVFLLGGVRTPQGSYGGALAAVRPDDLAALVVGAAARPRRGPGDAVDEVVLGAANQAGEDNRNVARMAVLLAGLPHTVPGYTVNRLCASGLTAIAGAAQAVRAGEADLVVAGGVESMTRAPWVMAKPGTPWARPGEVVDTSLGWRFANPRFTELDRAAPQRHTGPPDRSPCRWARPPRRSPRWTASPATTATRSRCAATRRAVAAAEDGRFDGEIVAGPGAAAQGRPGAGHRGRGPARRRLAGAAGRAAPGVPRGTASSPRATPRRCPTAPRPSWWRASARCAARAAAAWPGS